MKARTIAVFLVAMFLVFGYHDRAVAFHSGGVAYCDGCHTMHNSSNGSRMGTAGSVGQANAYLLQGTDQSSTCLICHSGSAAGGEKVATYPSPAAGAPPVQLTPGGDFAWVKKTYSWTTSDGVPGSSAGERHGHNIVAADFNFVVDSTLTTAPGGTYDAAKLHCSSCHDPHGRYRITANPVTAISASGNAIAGSGSYGDLPTADTSVGVYRLLGGKSYAPKSSGYTFSYDPPIAVAPTSYNRPEDQSDTRVVYGKYTGDWCANCHEAFHSVFGSGFVHPAGTPVNTDIANNYNLYVKTGRINGTVGTAYTSMVPIQNDNTNDLTVLAGKVGSTAGASSNDRVVCLTCHRAHASGWDSMTRWNNKSEFLVVKGEYPGTDASTAEAQKGQYHLGRTKAEVAKTFYGRSAGAYASFQRSLCNKCHIKD